jgi:hypothetical protein
MVAELHHHLSDLAALFCIDIEQADPRQAMSLRLIVVAAGS